MIDPALLQYLETPERRAARELVQRERDAALVGLPGAAASFVLGAQLLAAREGGSAGPPCLVVTATQEEAEEIREEIETFAGLEALFFPPWESRFLEGSEPDEAIYHDRLLALKRLRAGAEAPAALVAPVMALLEPVPSLGELDLTALRLARGREFGRDGLAARLAAVGFRHAPLILKRGEYSVRGDIVDVFSFDAARPIRVEFFGDTIDSIRHYHIEDQRSIGASEMESLELLLPPLKMMFRPPGRGEGPSLIDLLPPASRLAIVDPGSVRERLDRIAHNLLGDADRDVLAGAFLRRLEGRPSVRLHSLALEAGSTLPSLSLDFAGADRFQAAELETSMARITGAIAQGSRFTIYCESDAERQRISEILADHAVPSGAGREGPIELRIGAARRGFEVRALGRVFLSSRELFNRRSVRRARRLPAETRVVQSFFDLEEGDIVVHLVHGLGRFLGVVRMEKDGVMQEFLVVEYRDGVKIYVPASKIDLVQKYVGRGEHAPALDRVGGASWSRRKEAVERAIMDYASELLEIQAIRQERPGVAYPSDNDWQRQFEAAFPYDDTPDQRQATLSVKADLQAPRPMDRLLCGDVGYGKTEIAMRAAFKVVQAGKQAVVLVPTTVLAQQHCRTFRERMAGFPFRIEQLSRFSTAREQKETIEAARRGQVDILIGTHRVLSDDVGFQDLGLVVIDEEQRFGVGHKEKLKRLRAMVDILTLTATPIPRTLHLSLLGIRDISSLTTPPEGRSPISTDVIEFDRRVIRDATLRELNREGQVYFVHNRVQDIHLVCHQLQQLVPEARIEHAHGQMSERELEDIMMRFLDRRVDVLVSTTIIETGIDIPNVNTIFVNECDRYGLADLHQLRGRVGRSRHRAYCYLILPEHRHVNPDARKRIQAIREFSQLGAGFQIAMRDLEIRGAGNILGAEQSGHIAVVGYDLYCRLLEKAVKGLQGEEAQKAVDVEIDLNLEAYIPEDVIRDEGARLEVYRRVSKAQEVKALDELLEEFRDRFGAPTPPVERLFDVQRLRILAARAGLRSLRYDEDSIIIGGGERMRPLLDACPLRVVVLDPGHLALVVNDPRRRRSLPLNDELVFRSMLEWLEHGRLPSPLGGRMAVAGRS